MQGKVVVITGATSGIGQVAAERLAGMGARLVLVARDKVRGQAMLARLRERAPGLSHSIHYADLLRVVEMKRVAAEIAQAEPRIDVLINNAGAMFNTRRVTEDALEMTFALNHMAYFVLTSLLLPKMGAGARIVSTASDAHSGAKLDFSDLQSSRHYSGFAVYGRSKLCNIMFTREQARRLNGTGITANCFHPGFVATRFGDQSGGLLSRFVWLAKFFAISPEKGAKTIVHLASSPDVAGITGKYFDECRETTPSRPALDDPAALLLWDRSAAFAGMKA